MTRIDFPLITRKKKLSDKLWVMKLDCLEFIAESLQNDVEYDHRCGAFFKKIDQLNDMLRELSLADEVDFSKSIMKYTVPGITTNIPSAYSSYVDGVVGTDNEINTNMHHELIKILKKEDRIYHVEYDEHEKKIYIRTERNVYDLAGQIALKCSDLEITFSSIRIYRVDTAEVLEIMYK